MKKFEYKVIQIPYLLGKKEKELNKMGSEGWEAVGITSAHSVTQVLLKREIK